MPSSPAQPEMTQRETRALVSEHEISAYSWPINGILTTGEEASELDNGFQEVV